MKTIWFVDKDAAPIEEYFTQQRAVRQAQFFHNKGFDVKIICSSLVHNSSINHLEGENGDDKEEIYDGVPFVFVKSIAYKGNGLKRILSYYLFSRQLNRIGKKYGHPDIICHNSKIPFDMPVYKYARSIQAKYIIDVQDLWPRCFETMGYLGKKNPLLKWAYKKEEQLYSKASHVVFTMEGCHQYVKDQKYNLEQGGLVDLSRVHYVNNGIDLAEFNKNRETCRIDDVDLQAPHSFKVIYLGSIRPANNLDSLLDAAVLLKNHKDIKFLIYGGGTERERLEQRVKNEDIGNVIFKATWILPKYVPFVLSRADLNLMNYSNGLGYYGGSMNKMFLAFASGKPLLCNASIRFSDINTHHLGICRSFDSPEEYADAIMFFHDMPKDDYASMCARVSEISKRYDINYLCKKFADCCEINRL